jgi:hypothetical protein
MVMNYRSNQRVGKHLMIYDMAQNWFLLREAIPTGKGFNYRQSDLVKFYHSTTQRSPEI